MVPKTELPELLEYDFCNIWIIMDTLPMPNQSINALKSSNWKI